VLYPACTYVEKGMVTSKGYESSLRDAGQVSRSLIEVGFKHVSMTMNRLRRFLVAAIGLLSTMVMERKTNTASSRVRRYHCVTGLRPEMADYYFKLHASTWPGVLRMIKKANIRNFSIAVKEIEGKLYLFSYYEYAGDDYEGDMKRVGEDPETQRWWRETESCQLPLPDAVAKGGIWSGAKEIFHTA
jgi:L-rhamnose mutarotase